MTKHQLGFSTAIVSLVVLAPTALAQQGYDEMLANARVLASAENPDIGAVESALAGLSHQYMSDAHNALYFEILGLAYRDADPSLSARYYDNASNNEERAYRRYEQALAHERAGEVAQSLSAFERAYALEPDNRNIALSYAYALRRAGRDNEAAVLFAEAQDGSVQVLLDEAYANLAAGQSDSAASNFRAALNAGRASGEINEVRAYGIRREIQQLQDRVNGQAFISYRDNSFETAIPLPEDGVSLGQVGAEISYQPPETYNAGQGVSVFARGYASFDDGSLNADGDSVQYGVGANWKPIRTQNLNFAIERMIAGGDNARDAWLARAQYGAGQGFDWQPGEDSWAYSSFYAGLAHIIDEPTFTSFYASARHGRRFAVGDKVAITPYVTAVVQWSEDEFAERERYEFGPGISLNLWTNETDYWAPSQRIDFELEYRVAGGDSEDSFVGQIVWNF
jgi:tetratricopeptide (TPR) repeat protein